MESADLRHELNCSICLNVYVDPMMLPCGHNYCQECIEAVLDSQKGCGGYTCPECRTVFQLRPALQRNRKLGNIAEQLFSVQQKKVNAEIYCTYCVHSPVPAVKSCLQCETSLCDNHLTQHNDLVEHILIDPTTSTENRRCCIHKKLLEYYCFEDGASVCVSCCLVGEHRGHKVELICEAAEKRRKKMCDIAKDLTSQKEEAELQVHRLQARCWEEQEKANDITEGVMALFRNIAEQLKALEKRALSEISQQKERVSLSVSDLIQQLEIKKDELSKKISDIEKVTNTADSLTVIKEWESYGTAFRGAKQADEDKNRQASEVGEVDNVQISLFLHRALTKILNEVQTKNIFYIREASDILLDVNTSAADVEVSSDLKIASWSGVEQRRPNSQDRFENCQVLSVGGISSGKHYWEVETSVTGDWSVGVAYPSIDRQGDQSYIGNNSKSWGMDMYGDKLGFKEYSVIHNKENNKISFDSPCKRLMIYMDYEAGRLSFYELSDPMRHLHTFMATFKESLHPVFYVSNRAWVRIGSQDNTTALSQLYL